MKNASYHVSCLTIYIFSDGPEDYYEVDDGFGDYDGYGDYTDEVGKSTKLTQFWFKIYKIGSKVFSQLKNKITKQKQIEKVYNFRKYFPPTVSTAERNLKVPLELLLFTFMNVVFLKLKCT